MVNKKLYKEINEYVKLNNLGDIDLFIDKLIQYAFTIEKFGIGPPINQKEEIKSVIKKEDDKIINTGETSPNKDEDDLYNE